MIISLRTFHTQRLACLQGFCVVLLLVCCVQKAIHIYLYCILNRAILLYLLYRHPLKDQQIFCCPKKAIIHDTISCILIPYKALQLVLSTIKFQKNKINLIQCGGFSSSPYTTHKQQNNAKAL